MMKIYFFYFYTGFDLTNFNKKLFKKILKIKKIQIKKYFHTWVFTLFKKS